VTELVDAGQPFWLDIEDPTGEAIDQLAALLELHPLAIEDSKQFGQRPKLEVYGNGVMLVGFGLHEQLREPVEVHCYYTTGFMITLRRAVSPALDAMRRAAQSVPGRTVTRSVRCTRLSARFTPSSRPLSCSWTNGWMYSSSACSSRRTMRNSARSPQYGTALR
jgi:Mg2+ and Co2+ transporter CorA